MRQSVTFELNDIKAALASFVRVKPDDCELENDGSKIVLSFDVPISAVIPPAQAAEPEPAPAPKKPPTQKKKKIGDNPRLYNYKGTPLTIYVPGGVADTKPPRASNEANAELDRARKKNPHMNNFELADMLGWKRITG